ncbi:MAG TPA: malto-oligosyltrehalose synthase [bacterium]|nr:malto-oligosyltrehalose synthase [bacterium]
MHVPGATYRIQLRKEFGFDDATGILEYLSQLGITDIYASPVFSSRPGSSHGYDVVDPCEINPELGGEEGFRRLAARMRELKMNVVQDVVPNHMAYDSGNRMLMDVLENGERSPYRSFFDIEWGHVYESIRGRILAPFLGRFYGEALEAGEISLCYGPDGLFVKYYELKLPLRIESYSTVFTHRMDELAAKLGEHHPDLMKLSGTLHALTSVPDGDGSSETGEQIRFAKEMLWDLACKSPGIRAHVDAVLKEFNGTAGDSRSFDLLDGLLSKERFRLSFWKVATEEINYRRFFNINELISLRVEDESVLDRTHSLIFRLMDEGLIAGLRIDHIDGLYDPTRYLRRMKEKTGGAYIVVEKILGRQESIPRRWPVEGTTGYDFMGAVNGLFCDGRNRRRFQRIYEKHGGGQRDPETLAADKKRMIIGKHMAGDIDNLAHLLKTISGLDRYGRDITMYGLRRALVEVMACFPAYRSYVDAEGISPSDRLFIKEAVSFARRSSPNLFYEFNFLEKCLLLEFAEMLSEEERGKLLHFVMRFQQFTGPLMAKGFEDTTLYIFNRLVSLNEVGGDPGSFGVTVKDFHAFNSRRAKRERHALCSTATHDTKRGEDARTRISVLSEIPNEWEMQLKAWRKVNSRFKSSDRGRKMPDANDEYFLYQTLLGSWPSGDADMGAYRERLHNYLIKAVREAKVHTAWLKPDEVYEGALLGFVDALVFNNGGGRFMELFRPFAKKVAFFGMISSLSQVLLKATCPGVPDIYQGTELWDYSFVDPDNRRPVDYGLRERLLSEMRALRDASSRDLIRGVLNSWQDGRVKLFLTHAALTARGEHSDLFKDGDYVPLKAEGLYADHVVAFARRLGNDWVVAVAPRLLTHVVSEGELPLGQGVWRDTRIQLPPEAPEFWRDALSGAKAGGREMLAGDILDQFPCAMLFPA